MVAVAAARVWLSLASCPSLGSRIWLVDQIVDPFIARLELTLLGQPMVAFGGTASLLLIATR